jgi:MOSC domain-containing protein YiiM
MAELEAGLSEIARSPKDSGRLELIVRRPAVGEREVPEEGELDAVEGLVGDTWKLRSSSRTPDRTPHPDMQINIMNARAIALIAGERARWPLAGDQLYVDLDLSLGNLAPGIRLAIGTAIVEVTAEPHTGCHKFAAHFGAAATKFVNSPTGRAFNLRGVNARVVVPGRVRTGDAVSKVPALELA